MALTSSSGRRLIVEYVIHSDCGDTAPLTAPLAEDGEDDDAVDRGRLGEEPLRRAVDSFFSFAFMNDDILEFQLVVPTGVQYHNWFNALYGIVMKPTQAVPKSVQTIHNEIVLLRSSKSFPRITEMDMFSLQLRALIR